MQPDINALLTGFNRGRNALQGIMPSAQNAGGAPPGHLDPIGPRLKFLHSQIMSAIADLNRMHADHDAQKLMKAAEHVMTVMLDRRKRIAQDATDLSTGQANPLRLHAMGSNVNG